MKKVALSLAGLLAAAAFAPEASALPVFARQTGMACNACHFQHFPLLNQFGRAFKSGAFTMMGAQGKVEDTDHPLSIPNVVNAAVLTSMGYEKTNAWQDRAAPTHTSVVNAAGQGGSTTGSWFVGGEKGEMSLFIGGRGSDFMGFLSEVTMGNGAAAADSVKTPILAEVGGGVRAGLVFFTTNAQGASYGFETMNTGANAIHSITNTVGFNSEYINAVSAQQYINTAGRATGASIVANSDMGFINVSKFTALGPDSGGGFTALGSTYARIAYQGDLAGWDAGIGVQNWRGSSLSVVPGAGVTNLVVTGATPAVVGGAVTAAAAGPAIAIMDTKAQAVDAQMQGTVGTMPLGFYLTYAKAPASTATSSNFYNTGTKDRSSFNIAAEIGVMPEKTTIGAAIRRGKAGFADAAGADATDNAIFLTATYKLAQNLLTRLSYVQQSGTAWTSNTQGTGSSQIIGSKTWTVNLYALF